MRILVLIIFLLPIVLLPAPQASAQSVIKKTETHNVFKGVFYSIWSKLRSLNPHQRQSAKANVVYTAGIRGAESTDTLIQPYWKGDLTNDKQFQAELKQFTLAQQFMDKGELKASVKAFSDFINQYASSELMANALIGKGISLAGLGKKAEASVTLKQFIEDNPTHPLIMDAKQILTQLN